MNVLLNEGSDTNLEDNNKMTPVVSRGIPAHVIHKMITPRNVYRKDARGDTIMEKVIRLKRWDLISLLVQVGIDSSEKDKLFNFSIAVTDKHVPLNIKTELLSQHSEKVKSSKWQHLMVMALKKECWDVVPQLINMGAYMCKNCHR